MNKYEQLADFVYRTRAARLDSVRVSKTHQISHVLVSGLFVAALVFVISCAFRYVPGTLETILGAMVGIAGMAVIHASHKERLCEEILSEPLTDTELQALGALAIAPQTPGWTTLMAITERRRGHFRHQEGATSLALMDGTSLPSVEPIRSVRILEILAHGFHDYAARECVRGLFRAPPTQGCPDHGSLEGGPHSFCGVHERDRHTPQLRTCHFKQYPTLPSVRDPFVQLQQKSPTSLI